MLFSLLGLTMVSLLALSGEGVDPVHYYRHDGRQVLPRIEFNGEKWVLGRMDKHRQVLITNRILVRFKAEADIDKQALIPNGLEKVSVLKGLHPIWILRARRPIEALDACANLVESGLASWAVPDYLIPAELLFIPDDALYPDQWHLGGQGHENISAEDAWDLSTGDAHVVVAILDTGVDTSHPDLDPGRMIQGYDAVHDDDDPRPSSKAIDHHGTACAGLAFATGNNSIGVSGVCPGCSWMAVRVFDDGGYMALSALSKGILWAVDHGAWVLSNSWVVSQSLIDSGVDIEPVREAVRYAVEKGRDGKGCVVLFAAGNGDSELNAEQVGPDELQSMDEVLTVGGCDQNGIVAKYSNYGPSVSVVAPTWSGYPEDPYITTTDTSKDEGTNRGGIHYHTDPGGQDVATNRIEPDEQGNYTAFFSGTSASCPIAAGLAGLVLSVKPDLDWRQVRALMEDTAEKVGKDAGSSRVAADYDQDGFDPHYGHGRINAVAALVLGLYGEDQADGNPCWLDQNCLNSCVHKEPEPSEGVCAKTCADSEQCDSDQECQEGVCAAKLDRDIEGGCSCSLPGDRSDDGQETLLFILGMLMVIVVRHKHKLHF